MFTDMIAEIVRVAGSDYKYGIAARFIRLTERHGFKFFWSEYKVEKTHRFQKIAHKFGVAPRILSDIYSFNTNPYGDSRQRLMQGYFTEAICETLHERATRIVGDDYYKQDIYINKVKRSKTWGLFRSKWDKLPFCLDDMHASNIGFMGKKARTPYIIDFSECSE